MDVEESEKNEGVSSCQVHWCRYSHFFLSAAPDTTGFCPRTQLSCVVLDVPESLWNKWPFSNPETPFPFLLLASAMGSSGRQGAAVVWVSTAGALW